MTNKKDLHKPPTQKEVQKMMTEAVQQVAFNQASNFLGTDTMKKHGLTPETATITKMLEIAQKKHEALFKNKK